MTGKAAIFEAMPTGDAQRIWDGGPDAYGNPPERAVSDGSGLPCRHCVQMIADGKPYLIIAYRPFESITPYAETGPVFLHADPCQRAESSGELPQSLDSPSYLVRGYSDDQRIVYGTGSVVARVDVSRYAGALFANPAVAFVDVRSASNNCFQCRILADDQMDIMPGQAARAGIKPGAQISVPYRHKAQCT